jgi:hypothetical protein
MWPLPQPGIYTSIYFFPLFLSQEPPGRAWAVHVVALL